MSVFRGIIGSLTINLDANVAGFESDLGRAERSARRQIGQINRQLRQAEASSAAATQQMRRLATQVAAVGAIGLGVAVVQFRNLAKEADRIGKLATQTGLTAEAVQELGFAAEQSGSDVESLNTSIVKMQRNIQQAEDGLSTYTRAFQRIGIDVEELRGLRPDEQFTRIAQALSQLDSEVVRNASAMDILGRSAQNLLPLIAQGEAGINELREQLRATGSVLSQDAVDDAQRFNDAMNLLTRQLTAVRNSVFADIIEPLANVADFFTRTEQGAQKLASFIDLLKKSAIGLGVFLAGRFIVQLGAAIIEFTIAERRVRALTRAKANLAVQAGVTAGAVGTLGRSMSLLFGPVGTAVFAVSTLVALGRQMRDVANDANDLNSQVDRLLASTEELALAPFRESFISLDQQIFDRAQEIASLEQQIQQRRDIGPQFEESEGGAAQIQQRIDAINELEQAQARDIQQQQQLLDRIVELKQEQTEAAAAQELLKNATNETAEAVKNAADLTDEYQRILSRLVGRFRPIQAAQQRFANDFAVINAALISGNITIDQFIDALQLLQRELAETFDQGGDDAPQEFQLFSTAIDLAVSGLDQMEDDFQRAERGMENLASSIHPAIAAYNQFGREIETVNEAVATGVISEAEGDFTRFALSAEFLFGTLAQAARDGSREQKALAIAADVTNAVLAIQAVLNQAQGDQYSAFFRMAAMAAIVAQLGYSVGAFGGGGGSSVSLSQQRQASQGTGTVLGDVDAKTESIVNATEITADATSELVGISRGMLRALQSLQEGITGATTLLARGASQIEFSPAQSQGLSEIIGDPFGDLNRALDLLGIDDLLGGSAEVVDEGIRILGGTLEELINETLVDAFQSVEVSKHILDDTDLEEQFISLGADVAAQFSLIFQSIRDTVEAAGEALGIPLEEIQARIAEFEVEAQRISLLGLDAEEQQAELEAVFGAIFDDLAEHVIPFITQFQQVGEGLGETLVRVATSVQVFDEAVSQLGLAFDLTDPEQIAQVAVSLVELTGGVEEFITLFTGFVDKFASEEQKLAIAADQINRAFEQIGLSLPDTREGLFALVQSLDATTEAGREQIATILQIADVASEYYDLVEEAEQARLSRIQTFADFTGTGAPSALVALRQRLLDAAEAADQLGASQAEYALIVRSFDRQLQRMRLEMTRTVIQLSQDLFSSEADSLSSSFESEFESVREVANSLFSEWQRALTDLKGFADSLLLDESLTTLTPQQRLDEARRQFERTLAAARGGDVEAASELPEISREFLEIARFMFASGRQFDEIFREVQGALRGVEMPAGIEEFTRETATNTANTVTAIERMQNELLKGIDELIKAQDLANALRDLSFVSSQSAIELADELGVPLDQLAETLGIDLDDLSETTLDGFASFADLLGVGIVALGDALGVDIAALAESFGRDLSEFDFTEEFTTEISLLEEVVFELQRLNEHFAGGDAFEDERNKFGDPTNPIVTDPIVTGTGGTATAITEEQADAIVAGLNQIQATLETGQRQGQQASTATVQGITELNESLRRQIA